ncbi:MFS transporter [Streptomyces triticisoli]|jgi:MFS family permease|uniref:MFS transporter n=1 Tax=Streptomyces triticisoli TaxID=2182797 RepID=UPI000DD7B446|nr:MFS transporter [Streptomyces triticisoli]
MSKMVEATPPPRSGPPPAGDDTGRLEDASKGRLITILLLIVLFSELVPMQYLLVTPAVQKIGQSFPDVGANLSWMIIILGLVGGATCPLMGKLSDLYGKKRVLLAGGGVFLVGSVMCAATSSWALFLTGRGLQATALGMAAVVPGLIRDLLPRRYVPMGVGLMGAGFGLSALASPFLAGVLTDHFGWRSIFWFLTIYTVVTMPVFWAVVPETRLRVQQKLNWIGAGLLGAGAALVLLYLSNGQSWGWSRPDALVYLGAGVVLLIGFYGWEKRTSAPIMDLTLLRAPRVAIVLVISLLANMIIGAQSFIVPYMAQTDGDLVRESTIAAFAKDAGVAVEAMREGLVFQGDIGYGLAFSLLSVAIYLTVWQSAPSLLLGPASGAWARRVGLRLPYLISLVLMTLAMVLYALSHSSWQVLAGIGLVYGIGYGVYNACAYNLIVEGVPQEQQGIGTGMLVLIGSFGSSAGIAILTSVLSAHPYQVTTAAQAGEPARTIDIAHVYTDAGWTLGYWGLASVGVVAVVLAFVMKAGRTPATGGSLH